MNKATITREEVQTTLWKALDSFRGKLAVEEYYEAVLEVLLWSALVPITRDGAVGYFDTMQSVKDDSSWDQIQALIDKECFREVRITEKLRSVSYKEIEELRAALLPLGRAIANGNKGDREIITEALLQVKGEWLGRRGVAGCSQSMGQLLKQLNKNIKEGDCLLIPHGRRGGSLSCRRAHSTDSLRQHIPGPMAEGYHCSFKKPDKFTQPRGRVVDINRLPTLERDK